MLALALWVRAGSEGGAVAVATADFPAHPVPGWARPGRLVVSVHRGSDKLEWSGVEWSGVGRGAARAAGRLRACVQR
jgi:hypothetical protein